LQAQEQSELKNVVLFNPFSTRVKLDLSPPSSSFLGEQAHPKPCHLFLVNHGHFVFKPIACGVSLLFCVLWKEEHELQGKVITLQ